MRYTGQAIVRADNVSLEVTDASIDVGGPQRETVYADFKRAGFIEKPKASNVKGTCRHSSNTDLIAIANAASVTITFECDTGEVYTVSDACSMNPPELSTDGTFTVEFEGNPAIKS